MKGSLPQAAACLPQAAAGDVRLELGVSIIERERV